MHLVRSALLLALVAAPVLAQDGADAEPEVLHTWGKLDPERKSDVGTLEYVDTKGERPRKAEAYVVVDERTRFYGDRAVPLEALEAGTKVWVLGTPVERDTTTQEGRTITDRQITNALAVVAGEDVAPASKKPDPERQPELRWVEATIQRSGQAPSVTYNGQEYRLSCARNHVVLVRTALEERPSLRREVLVEVEATPTDERPEEAKDEELPVVRASRLVLLDRRAARGVYPLLLP